MFCINILHNSIRHMLLVVNDAVNRVPTLSQMLADPPFHYSTLVQHCDGTPIWYLYTLTWGNQLLPYDDVQSNKGNQDSGPSVHNVGA